MAGRQGLGIRDVEAGGADLAALEGRDQGVGVDDLAARDVDEVDVLLHQLELAGADHALRGRRVRHGGEDDVGPRQQVVELVGLADVGDVAVDRDVLGIDADHGHAEGRGPLRDLGADAAQADDQGRLAPELDHRQCPVRVPAFRHLGVERLDVAGEVQEQGEGVVGDLRALDDLRIGQGDVAVAQVWNLEEALDPGGVALNPAQLAVGRQEVLDAAVARDQAVADVRVETLFQGDQVEVVVLVLQVRERVGKERRHAHRDGLPERAGGREQEEKNGEQNRSEIQRWTVEHGRVSLSDRRL